MCNFLCKQTGIADTSASLAVYAMYCNNICCTGMLSGRPQMQPSFSVHVEVGRGAATWSGNGIAFQQKVPVTRHVGFEVSCELTPACLYASSCACVVSPTIA